MKPISVVAAKDNRSPLIDCNYRPMTLDGFRGRCVTTADTAFLEYQRSVFSKRSATRFSRRSSLFRRSSSSRQPCLWSARQMQWSNFVAHLLRFDSTVVPQRKSKEETIVRPSRIHVKSFLDGRAARGYSGEEAQAAHHYHRCLGAWFDSGDDSHLAPEAGSAEHRSLDRLDRYR